MTDTSYAQELLHEAFPIGFGRNVKAAIKDAFWALKRHEDALPADIRRDRERPWTERRVRSIWENSARRIDHYEIEDLKAVAPEEAIREAANRALAQRVDELEAQLAVVVAALARDEVAKSRLAARGQGFGAYAANGSTPHRRSTD